MLSARAVAIGRGIKLLDKFVAEQLHAHRRDLAEFWRWQGGPVRAALATVVLGADFDRQPRVTTPARPVPAQLLCVGILEPRKNQMFLLDVCEALWASGVDFELHLVGRVNPHFGRPVAARLKALRRTQARVHHHEAASDALMNRLFATARATAFPTIAEGCGLPVLESLWKGRPCVCSDLPVLREISSGGGCRLAAPNDQGAWAAALRTVLTDESEWRRLAGEAASRPLPVWADTGPLGRIGIGREFAPGGSARARDGRGNFTRKRASSKWVFVAPEMII